MTDDLDRPGAKDEEPIILPYMTPEYRPNVVVEFLKDRRVRWGAASLVCGVASFVLPFLIPVALFCGYVAMMKERDEPSRYGGAGLGKVGMITGGFAILAAPFIYDSVWFLEYHRELSRRTVCASNLKGIATGLYTYGNESGELWANSAHRVPQQAGAGETDYTRAIGSYRSRDTANMLPRPMVLSTTRNLWLLVRQGLNNPPEFICPSTGDQPNREPDARGFYDFGEGSIMGEVDVDDAKRFYRQVSYGYQISYGNLGIPGSNRDARMVLGAEKGPYGAAIEAGRAAPPRNLLTQNSAAKDWRPFNSPNHKGRGQNVLVADGHIEFAETPLAGIGGDNIYTRWSDQGATVIERLRGDPPTPGGKETPMANTDTFVYP